MRGYLRVVHEAREQVEVGDRGRPPRVQILGQSPSDAQWATTTRTPGVEGPPQPQRIAEILAERAHRALVARMRDQRQAQIGELAVEAVAARGSGIDALRRRQPFHGPRAARDAASRRSSAAGS